MELSNMLNPAPVVVDNQIGMAMEVDDQPIPTKLTREEWMQKYPAAVNIMNEILKNAQTKEEQDASFKELKMILRQIPKPRYCPSSQCEEKKASTNTEELIAHLNLHIKRIFAKCPFGCGHTASDAKALRRHLKEATKVHPIHYEVTIEKGSVLLYEGPKLVMTISEGEEAVVEREYELKGKKVVQRITSEQTAGAFNPMLQHEELEMDPVRATAILTRFAVPPHLFQNPVEERAESHSTLMPMPQIPHQPQQQVYDQSDVIGILSLYKMATQSGRT